MLTEAAQDGTVRFWDAVTGTAVVAPVAAHTTTTSADSWVYPPAGLAEASAEVLGRRYGSGILAVLAADG